MPDIFVSWGSPDAAGVGRLSKRLKDLVELDVWEYSEDMAPGGHLNSVVFDKIDQSQIALVCFSDATADRPWINTELGAILAKFSEPKHPLKSIVPIWVGPHPQNRAPQALAQQFAVRDLAGGSEAALEQLVRQLFPLLGRQMPRVIPAALFAMTSAQFDTLSAAPPAGPELPNLCRSVGMPSPPALWPALGTRYRADRRDFAPFDSPASLVQIIEQVVRHANGWRVSTGRRPLFLRWVHDEIVPGTAYQPASRDLWRSTDALLVVDSVSTYHPDVSRALDQVHVSERTTVLWVPPYTRHLGTLQSLIDGPASTVLNLGDVFRAWTFGTNGAPQPVRRPVASFDSITCASLQNWLHQSFVSVPDEMDPLSGQADAFRKAMGSAPANIADLLRAAGRAGQP